MADHRALFIMQIRIRGLERPQRLAIGARTAGVDLPPGGMRLKDELLTRREPAGSAGYAEDGWAGVCAPASAVTPRAVAIASIRSITR